MIRPLALTAAISFVVALASFSGAAALAGPEILAKGYSKGFWRDFAWDFSDSADALYETGAADRTQMRTLKDFSEVSASAADVELAIGPAFRVEVTGADPARIETRVEDGELVIEPARSGFWRRGGRALVKVTLPTLDSLSAAAGARIKADGLQAKALRVEASSGAAMTLRGACESIDAEVSTGASIDADGLVCGAGDAEASTGGELRVNVNGPLNVEASTGGAIHAGANAKIGEIELSSGGALERP